ncbi:MAG: response regulator [Algoriphagus sp.]|jgi:CheY-like chemotaxis protein|uniref:response regulator n=1 Tax=Algoriphagus sp. TaxID=1872435 RepID=UPI00261C24C6|nr:response regulator [Algoriphagus sp.]MDG1276895.1 response regulator [Algoriphagus sp.]
MRVLVVDDDNIHLLILKKIFEKSQDDVVLAHNGLEALRFLREDPHFHVILTDIMMPEMDGIEFLTQLKNNLLFKSIPVIGFTAGDVEYFRKNSPNKFDTLIPKPHNFWDLYLLAKDKATKDLN